MEAHGIPNTLFRFSQVYHVNHLLSAAYFKGYSGLSRLKRIEWNNRWFWPLLLSCFVHALCEILITDSCIHLIYVLLIELFMQGYVNCSCHFYHSYVIVLGVLVKSLFRLFWQPTQAVCYFAEFPIVYICIGGSDAFSYLCSGLFEMLVSALFPGVICFWTEGDLNACLKPIWKL